MAHSAEQPSSTPAMDPHHPHHPHHPAAKKPSLLGQLGEQVADRAMDSQLSDEEKEDVKGLKFKEKTHKVAEIEEEKGLDYLSQNISQNQDIQNFWSTYCGCFGSSSSNQNQT